MKGAKRGKMGGKRGLQKGVKGEKGEAKKGCMGHLVKHLQPDIYYGSSLMSSGLWVRIQSSMTKFSLISLISIQNRKKSSVSRGQAETNKSHNIVPKPNVYHALP